MLVKYLIDLNLNVFYRSVTFFKRRSNQNIAYQSRTVFPHLRDTNSLASTYRPNKILVQFDSIFHYFGYYNMSVCLSFRLSVCLSLSVSISLSLSISLYLSHSHSHTLSSFFVCSCWRKCEGKENYCLKGSSFSFFLSFLFHTFRTCDRPASIIIKH